MTLVTLDGPFVRGEILDRPNRFTVRVRIDGAERRAYLRNSGGLETVLAEGRTILCRPVDDPDRTTDADAVAVLVDDVWATVDATLPNRVFRVAVEGEHVPSFAGRDIVEQEPALPDGGRADFRLAGSAIVEVKSNTYVVDGISKFPDRPTERGRRHLRTLTELAETEGIETHVVFVVQRPDVAVFRPFDEIDPAFGDRLRAARAAGVGLHAWATTFDPPEVSLASTSVPIELEEEGDPDSAR